MQKTASLLLVLAAVGLASCAPKAEPMEEAMEKPNPPPATVETVSSEESQPALPDLGLRSPDYLKLPSDSDLRSTGSAAPSTPSDSGAVSARPPTEPPSRPVSPSE